MECRIARTALRFYSTAITFQRSSGTPMAAMCVPARRCGWNGKGKATSGATARQRGPAGSSSAMRGHVGTGKLSFLPSRQVSLWTGSCWTHLLWLSVRGVSLPRLQASGGFVDLEYLQDQHDSLGRVYGTGQPVTQCSGANAQPRGQDFLFHPNAINQTLKIFVPHVAGTGRTAAR